MRRKPHRNRKSRPRRLPAFEMLEARHLLSGMPIITEFMASNESELRDNASPREYSDWIEIFNSGDEAIDLAGWHLTDRPGNLNKWTFPSVVLPAEEFLYVFASGNNAPDASGNLHTNFVLSREGEYLALVEPDDTTLASEFGSADADYPEQFSNVSYGFVQEVAPGGAITTLYDQLRYFQAPTPGNPNVPGSKDLGPIISGATHTPNAPDFAAEIVVSTTVREGTGTLDYVRLRYRVGFGGHTYVTMSDDGATGGDAVAGDGVYTATIAAAGGAAPGEMVRWYIEAFDTDGHNSRWPLFQKSSGQRQSEQYLGTVVADPEVTSQLPIYQLFVQDPSAADRRSGTRASLFYDGEFYDNVFIRERGNSSAALPKTNHRINLNRDHLFRADDSGYLFQKVNLQANFIDPAYMRETLEAETFGRAAVPAPLTQQVRLELNGEFFQLAGFVEHIDGDFLERVGLDPNGALYKNPIMLNMRNDTGRGTWANAEKITRIDVDGNGKSDLGALAAGIDELRPDDERARFIFDNVDIPAVINYMASFHVTQEADGMHINVMVYRDSDGTGEWRYLPFDMNYSFGAWFAADFITGNQDRHFGHPFYGAEGFEPDVRDYSFNRLQDAIISTPETRQMYLRRLRTLMDEFLQPPGTPAEELYFENRINEYQAAMQQDADLDRAKWGWPDISWHTLPEVSFDEGVQQLFDDYLAQRRVHLYETHSIDNLPDPGVPINVNTPAGIPHAQVDNPPISFGSLVYNPVSGNQDEEYIELRNPNDVAVDISGWQLSGGVRTTFQPGTVIHPGGTLYVSPDVVAFRNRAGGPTGGMRLFVQGYDGHLSNFGETITLTAADGELVNETTYIGDPSPQQLFLRVTEINYNPAPLTAAEELQGFRDNDDFEFIELQNIGSEALNVTGVRFTDGVEFAFPGVYEGSPVLITEATTSSFDGVEIQNVSSTVADTSGWFVVANDAHNAPDDPDINAFHATLWNLPDSINPEEALYRTDDADDPEHYWGENIYWRSAAKGWVMIVDDEGHVVDFVVWGYSEAEIASLNVNVNGFEVTADGAWSGGAVPQGESRINVLQRSGSEERDDASHWAFMEQESLGLTNTTLTVPFSGGPLLLGPGEYIVTVRNAAAFEARYGAGRNVAGRFAAGKLDNDGEILKLEDPRNSTILEFRYDDRGEWPRGPDGAGASLVVIDTSGDYNDPGNWRCSTRYGGTPGTDPEPEIGIVVNEVLTNTDELLLDAIELFNTTGDAIDLGGWYLSDSGGNLHKFEVPVGTVIPAGGYLVFDEEDFNPTPQNQEPHHFALDGANGDDVWLMEADATGKLTRFVDHVDFGAASAMESFGRWPNGQGRLYPMLTRTLDKAYPEDGLNSGPRVGPIILSEVHYNPSETADDDLEFVEIYNSTAAVLDLTEWRIRGGIDFDFPAGRTLPALSALVIVPFDLSDTEKLAAFLDSYGIGEPILMLGGYRGRLNNGGERIELQRPDDPPPDALEYFPRLLEDEVVYDDGAPWPAEADGDGESLARVAVDAWGNDPFSWQALSPTPGTTSFTWSSEVVGRHIFYNASYFDGNDPDADVQDDAAIAPDKVALLPGQTATFANYTSYSRGINGIMVDIAGLPNTPTAGDFTFKVGNDDNPGGGSQVPEPTSVTVRPGDGAGGSDRVTIVWPDKVIQKQWLQVTILATPNTGLVEPDVFYFGNAIGEGGNSIVDAKVNVSDFLGVRDNQRNFLSPAPIDFRFDFDRDARVDIVDLLIARNNQTQFLNALRLITVPAVKAAGEQASAGPRRAAQDAVFRQAVEREPERPGTSSGKLDWLHEFDQMSTQTRPSKRDQSAKAAADEVLAMNLL